MEGRFNPPDFPTKCIRVRFWVEPELPVGLAIAPETGAMHGKVSSWHATRDYTIFMEYWFDGAKCYQPYSAILSLRFTNPPLLRNLEILKS